MSAFLVWHQKAALVAELRLKWKDSSGTEHTYKGVRQCAPTMAAYDLIREVGIPNGTKGVTVGAYCVGAYDPYECAVTFDVTAGGKKIEYGVYGTIFGTWIEHLPDRSSPPQAQD